MPPVFATVNAFARSLHLGITEAKIEAELEAVLGQATNDPGEAAALLTALL